MTILFPTSAEIILNRTNWCYRSEDDFYCAHLNLASLEGCPYEINGYFDCSYNNLQSLKYCPHVVKSFFDCSHNKIESLKDIHKYLKMIGGIGTFYCHNNLIKSHVLGLFLVEGIVSVVGATKWADIVNKHIIKGRKGMLACQKELIESGLEEYAKL